MPNNDVVALREELFATVRALRDKDNPMEIERAKAVAAVGSVIIESAKVEVQMISAMGRGHMVPTGFIGSPPPDTLDRQRALEHAAVATPGNGLPPPGPRGKL